MQKCASHHKAYLDSDQLGGTEGKVIVRCYSQYVSKQVQLYDERALKMKWPQSQNVVIVYITSLLVVYEGADDRSQQHPPSHDQLINSIKAMKRSQ